MEYSLKEFAGTIAYTIADFYNLTSSLEILNEKSGVFFVHDKDDCNYYNIYYDNNDIQIQSNDLESIKFPSKLISHDNY